MTATPYRASSRPEAERRAIVETANELTTLYSLLVPAETPQAVYDALKAAHDELVRALRAHDAVNRPAVTP